MFLKSLFFVSRAAIFCLLSMGLVNAAAAQAAPPAAPVAQPGAVAAPTGDPFPAVNMKYFTADSPSAATVESFIHALWGFDANRIWRVEGIEKTASPGVTKVVVYVTEKGGANAKVQSTGFWVMPDGKHAIADTLVDFGATPYAAKRKMLQERANGPALGAGGKDLLLVEFSDLQCPHCKEAQAIMAKLVADYPKARIVYQPFPLVEIHPFAFQAASFGVCVAKQGTAAYVTFAQAVYDTQAGLTADAGVATLKAAVTKAGLDPAAISSCADTEATKAEVNASIKLASDLGIDSTPELAVNGRLIPLTQVPYDTLKTLINYQAMMDGVPAAAGGAPLILK